MSKKESVRSVVRNQIRKVLNEGHRSDLVRKFKRLQREFGDDKAISAVFDDFSIGRIKTAISQARKKLRKEKDKRRSDKFEY